jgi:hypothetical protein
VSSLPFVIVCDEAGRALARRPLQDPEDLVRPARVLDQDHG